MAFPHLVLDEGLEPHNVNTSYLFFTRQAQCLGRHDRHDRHQDRGLAQHKSQLRKPEELEGMIRRWAAEDAGKIGATAAEGFRLVKIG